MDRLKELGRGTQIMFIAAVLLLIDSFFRWQEVSANLGPLGEVSSGVSAWDDFLGILMGILTIVLIARIAARLAAVEVPIPLSFATTSFVLGVLIAVFAVLKNLTDDYSTWASYVGVVLAIIVAVGAWMEVQEAGGLETLRSEAASIGPAGGAAAGAGATGAAVAATGDQAADVAPEATNAAAESADAATSEAADAAGSAAEGAMDAAQETASGAAETMGDAADTAADAAQDMTGGPSTGPGA